MADVLSKSFDEPDDVVEFPKIRSHIVELGDLTVGRFTSEPGWRWSEHVKPVAGTEWCEAPHFQYSIAGTVRVQMSDGTEFDVGPGEISVLEPGHDAWVIGDEPAVVVDWGGAHEWGRPHEH